MPGLERFLISVVKQADSFALLSMCKKIMLIYCATYSQLSVGVELTVDN